MIAIAAIGMKYARVKNPISPVVNVISRPIGEPITFRGFVIVFVIVFGGVAGGTAAGRVGDFSGAQVLCAVLSRCMSISIGLV